MEHFIILFIIFILLLFIAFYIKEINKSKIMESFYPTMAADDTSGSSALYGWNQDTINPSWSEPGRQRKTCCSCPTS